jgi:hypothetical protein
MASEKKEENWFKKHSTEIIAASNIVLVAITAIYVIITTNLLRIAEDQMMLSSDPNVLIHYGYHPQALSIRDSILSFSIYNMSPTELINLSLRLKFYTYYIDSLQNEGFIEYNPSPSFEPDSVIQKLGRKSISDLKFDLSPDYPSLAKTEGYFYFKKSIDSSGHWIKMNLRKGKNFPFRLLVIELIFYRGIDGKKFVRNYFFSISGSPFMLSDAILHQYRDLSEFLNTLKKWSQGLLERDDLLPESWR